MKVKFLENVNINDKITVSKGETFEAREDGDFIMIRMKYGSTVKAPKSEIEGILEVVKSIKENIYFHREKEDNYNLEEKLEKKKFNTENILHLGSEIGMKIELFEDGTNRVLALNGVDLSDKNISV